MKKIVQAKIKQTEKLLEEYKDLSLSKHQFKAHVQKKRKFITSRLGKGESIKVVDGENQSIFSRNNLPVHHLVVKRHHGKI